MIYFPKYFFSIKLGPTTLIEQEGAAQSKTSMLAGNSLPSYYLGKLKTEKRKSGFLFLNNLLKYSKVK